MSEDASTAAGSTPGAGPDAVAERRGGKPFPDGIRLIGGLMVAFSIFGLLWGAAAVFLGVTNTIVAAGVPHGVSLLVGGGVQVAVSLAVFVFSFLVRRGHNGARWATVVIGLVGAGVYALSAVLVPFSRLSSIILAVIAVAMAGLLLTPRARDYFLR